MRKINFIVLILILTLAINTAIAGDFVDSANTDYTKNADVDSTFGINGVSGFTIFDENNTVIVKTKKDGLFHKIFGKKIKSDDENIKEVVEENKIIDEPIIPETKAEKKKEEKNSKNNKSPMNFANSDVNIYCDNMEYLQDSKEIVGTGNAKVVFVENNSTIFADKIVYNHDMNYIEGIDNVKIVKNNNAMFGDYTKIDLNYGNAMVDKPILNNYMIKVVAKTGNVTTDSIEAYDGIAVGNQDTQYRLSSNDYAMFFPMDIDDGMNRAFNPKDYKTSKKAKYHIKTNEIFVQARDGHDEVTFKNADLYLGKILIMKAGDFTLSTDKTQSFVETSIPEIGSMQYIGSYAGPSFLFNTPLSSTLKVTPVVAMDEGKFGVGFMARFRQKRNLTQMGYTTAANQFVVRGSQQFGDSDFFLEYAHMAYMSDWFFGSNISKYLIQLAYNKQYLFLDEGISLAHRATAGYLTDVDGNNGTARFRYQAQFAKEIASYKNYDKKFYASLNLISQGMMGVYGTGDATGVFRIGPSLRTQYKGWGQTITYFQSAKGGESPLTYTDDYRYGKSTVNIVESLRLHKYLSVGVYTTLNLLNDDPTTSNIFSEGRFMVSVGPEDSKLSFGYDFIRQGTTMYYTALLGSKNQDVKFKKLKIKDPDKLGKEKEENSFMKKLKFKIFTYDEVAETVPSTVQSAISGPVMLNSMKY